MSNFNEPADQYKNEVQQVYYRLNAAAGGNWANDINDYARAIAAGTMTLADVEAELRPAAGTGGFAIPGITAYEYLPEQYDVGSEADRRQWFPSGGGTVSPGSGGSGGISGSGPTAGSGGGIGSSGGTSAPTMDFRAEAAARFPWLTGALLNTYADFWADTGSPSAALSKLRSSADYKQTFQGIFREDGTMRMDENQYFSTKVGYREALTEFGRNPSQYENLFVRMIENEMDAGEFVRGAAEAYQRFIEPGADQDNGLFDSFLDSFIDSGSAVTALERVRESDAYSQVFVGNRREDGTLRMDETEWFAYKRGWSKTLAGFGLNPEEFMARDRLRESVEGEVSIQELNQRLQITQDGILDNIDAVRQFYSQYGVDVTAEAILGMAIDPDIQRDVLEGRITAAQIGGEASVQGFVRTVERAEQLAKMGVSQSQARELYGNAANRLPGLDATTRRFNLGGTGIGDFEQAVVGQDASQVQRFGRAMQREQSSFSSTTDTRRDQGGGLTGLRQR